MEEGGIVYVTIPWYMLMVWGKSKCFCVFGATSNLIKNNANCLYLWNVAWGKNISNQFYEVQ